MAPPGPHHTEWLRPAAAEMDGPALRHLRVHRHTALPPIPQLREGAWLSALLQSMDDGWAGPAGQPVWLISAHRRHRAQLSSATPEAGEAPIVFALSDEDAAPLTAFSHGTRLTLQCYLRPEDCGPRLQPLPLGPAAPAAPLIPWAERDVDVFFHGHLHRARTGWAQGLSGGWPLPAWAVGAVKGRLVGPVTARGPLAAYRTDLSFTDRFGGGISAQDYTQRLHRSRLALAPPGLKQAETFRHYEALRAGCVVLSDPMPTHPVLGTAPLVPAGRGADLITRITQLLSDTDQLAELHTRSCAWWTTVGCAQVTGQRVLQMLSEG